MNRSSTHRAATWWALLCGLALVGLPGAPWAAASCSVTISSPAGTYVSSAPLTLGGNLSVTCTKAQGDSFTSTAYSATVGTTHNLSALNGSSQAIAYGLWKDAGATQAWGNGTPTAITGTAVYNNLVATDSPAFYLIAPAVAQAPAAGAYLDNTQVTLAYSPDGGSVTPTSPTTTATGAVTLLVEPACSLGTVSAMAFSYTGGQATQANGSGGQFVLACTAALGYSLSLDDDAGNATGSPSTRTYTDAATQLQYTLSVPANGTGTGSGVNLGVTGTMGAQQAGVCPSASPCNNDSSNNRVRTLTVTFN